MPFSSFRFRVWTSFIGYNELGFRIVEETTLIGVANGLTVILLATYSKDMALRASALHPHECLKSTHQEKGPLSYTTGKTIPSISGIVIIRYFRN